MSVPALYNKVKTRTFSDDGDDWTRDPVDDDDEHVSQFQSTTHRSSSKAATTSSQQPTASLLPDFSLIDLTEELSPARTAAAASAQHRTQTSHLHPTFPIQPHPSSTTTLHPPHPSSSAQGHFDDPFAQLASRPADPSSSTLNQDSSPLSWDFSTAQAGSSPGVDAANASTNNQGGIPGFEVDFNSQHLHHHPSAPVIHEFSDQDDMFGIFSTPPHPSHHTPPNATAPFPPFHECMDLEKQSCHRSHSVGGRLSGQGGEEESSSARPPKDHVLDFEKEDGAVDGKRELILYALPLYQVDDTTPIVESLVFLPISSFQEVEEYSGVSGAIQERAEAVGSKISDSWADLKAKEDGTFGHAVYKVGNRVVNNLSAEERLTKSIPKNVSKVIIYHPTQVTPDLIMDRLTSMTSQHRLMSTAKAALAGLMLPVAFGIDIIIIPGPQVLTYYTSFMLYKNASSALGTTRLTKYIKQGGEAKDVRVNYAGDARLDPYFESLRASGSVVLDEEAIESMIAAIGEGELLEPMLELRARKLRESGVTKGSGSDKYTLLSSKVS